MPKCRLDRICGLDPWGEDLCILHARDPNKDEETFRAALKAHLDRGTCDFSHFVFSPYTLFSGRAFAKRAVFKETEFYSQADFGGTTFEQDADFESAKFPAGVSFHKATFVKRAIFSSAKFGIVDSSNQFVHSLKRELAPYVDKYESSFANATFNEESNFSSSEFAKARFTDSVFIKRADFPEATFRGPSEFRGARFLEGADFRGVEFTEQACFRQCDFRGTTIFEPDLPARLAGISIFARRETDFRDLRIGGPDTIIFRDADLTMCRFLNTDVRHFEFTGVEWPRVGSRLVVYDEIAPLKYYGDFSSPFQIERLYRQLKQNYEDRRDHERVSDFHYGEKEMRRKNPKTPLALRFFLTLYWLFSGYGERYLRPFVSAAILLVVSTFFYLLLGLSLKNPPGSLTLTSASDWIRATHYSLRVMLLLKPDDLIPTGTAQWVNTVQSIFGPLLFGLFALALRQRLKR